MKNKWNKQLIELTIEDFAELSDYYLEHTAKETCDYFNISETSLRRLCKKFCWTKPKNLVSSQRKKSCIKIDGKLVEIKGDHLYKKMLLPGTIENSKLKCLLANDVKIWVAKDYAFALEYLKQQHIELINYRR